MITIDEVQEMLDNIADNLPFGVLDGLNGGILLLNEEKLHPQSSPQKPLYIMGTYTYNPFNLGRYITIFYGSFVKTHGLSPKSVQEKALKDVLHHEIVHHLESQTGDRTLELWDKKQIEKYKESWE